MLDAVAAAGRSGTRRGPGHVRCVAAAAPAPVVVDRPRPDDPALLVDREALKTALQYPAPRGAAFDELPAEAFGHPAYVAVRARRSPPPAGLRPARSVGAERVGRLVREASANDAVRSVVTELAVEPLRIAGEPDARYVDEQVGFLQRAGGAATGGRGASRGCSASTRTADEYQQVFGELVTLEQQRRRLRERAVGGA